MKLGKKRKFIFGSGRYTEVKNEAADMMDTEAAEELGSGDGMTEDGVSSVEETAQGSYAAGGPEPGEESAQGSYAEGGSESQEDSREEDARESYSEGGQEPQEDIKEETAAEPYSEGGAEESAQGSYSPDGSEAEEEAAEEKSDLTDTYGMPEYEAGEETALESYAINEPEPGEESVQEPDAEGGSEPQEDSREEDAWESYSEGGQEPQKSAGEEIGKTDDGMISAKEAEHGEEPDEPGVRFFFGEKAEPGEESAQGSYSPDEPEAEEEEAAEEKYDLTDTYGMPEYEAGETVDGLISVEEAEDRTNTYEELLQVIDVQTDSIRGFERKLDKENEEVQKLINSIGDEFKLVMRKYYLYTERFNDREQARIKESLAAAIDEQIVSFTDRLSEVNTELYQRFAGQLDTERDRYEINLRDYMSRIREADEQYVKELEQTVNGLVEEDRRTARSFLEEDRKAVGSYLEKDRRIIEGLIESNRAAAENFLEKDRKTVEGFLESDRAAIEGFLAEDRRIVEGYLANDRQAFENYLENERKTLEDYLEKDRRVLESFLESDRKTVEGFLQQERALAGELKRDVTSVFKQYIEEQQSLTAKEHDRTQAMFDTFLNEEDVLINELTDKLELYRGKAEEYCRTVVKLGDEAAKLSAFIERGFRETFDSYLKELNENQSKNYESFSRQLGLRYAQSIKEQDAMLEKFREEYQEKLAAFVKDTEKEYKLSLEEETNKALTAMEDTVLDLQKTRKADQRNRRLFVSGVLFVAILSSLGMIFSNGVRGIAPIALSLLVSAGVYMLNTWRDS